MINNFKKLSLENEEDYLAIPGGNGGGAGEGQLFKNPFKEMHTMIRTYPCYHQSMQFNAYYSKDAGLYLATYDGQSHLKGFLLKPVKNDIPRMYYEIQNYPANSGVKGIGYHQQYPAIIGPFSGDWYDACRIYRRWALKQKWCRLGQTWQRDDLPRSLKEGSYWMMYALDFEPSDQPLLRKLARTLPREEVKKRSRRLDVDKCLANLKEAYDYFGYPLIVWVNSWWEGGGDTSPPRYIPVKNYELLLERIHSEFPGVKLSAHIQPKRYSIQCYEYDKEVEKSLEKDAYGNLAIGPVMPTETDDRHAYPCWATNFWQDFWAKKSYAVASLGTDGFHVDELGSATSFEAQCFNRAHGHPIGGGTLYADTRRNMISLIRNNARKAKPQFAAHHEVLCEIYIDVADLAEVCTTPSNINIPMYEAVFHDYNFIMGRRITKWHDRNLWHKGDEPGDEGIEEFVASFGQAYIWGNQPSWTRVDIVSYAPKVAAIIKKFMDSRYRAMKFLHYGDMMRPLVVTKPLPMTKTIWRMCDTPVHIMPAVINSVWKAPNEDSVGIVLVNITDKPQTIDYKCDLNECGLKADSYTITRIDQAKPENLGLYKGQVLTRSDTIEPRSVRILEIKPSY